jgi:cytosine/adenosine deaminase-related metal-dependent hydrolase
MMEDQVIVTDQEGTIIELLPVSEAGDDIEKFAGILSPGFINCHCHLELSHMKGLIPEGKGLVDFVFRVVTERHHEESEILQSIANAEAEMIQNGIVAVGDICNNQLTLPQKQKQNLRYYNFIEASGWLPAVAESRLERARELYQQYLKADSKNKTSIVPHAPYSVSNDLWNKLMPFFKHSVVSIHNQETKFEDEFFLNGTGDFNRMYELMKINNEHHLPSNKTSLQSYFEKLTDARSIILVHNTFTKEEDIRFVKKTETNASTYFCLCVNANLYIENALPPVELLRKNDCKIVLGTDSLASNWSLNILDEINVIRKNFPSIPLPEILHWATINGAKALQLDEEFGSFEAGKRPGIVLVDGGMRSLERLL